MLFSFPLTKCTFAKTLHLTLQRQYKSGFVFGSAQRDTAASDCHSRTLILSSHALAQAELVTTRKALAMLSNKQGLLTEEREQVDKESKRERADQTHIY